MLKRSGCSGDLKLPVGVLDELKQPGEVALEGVPPVERWAEGVRRDAPHGTGDAALGHAGEVLVAKEEAPAQRGLVPDPRRRAEAGRLLAAVGGEGLPPVCLDFQNRLLR